MPSTRVQLIAVLFALLVGPLHAATIAVTTTADIIDAAGNCASVTVASLPGPGGTVSLREAICAANNNAGDDTIVFAINGLFVLTGAANDDNGNTGDMDVKSSMSIVGNGPANTVIDGEGIERIFDVFPSAASTFNLSDLTLQNGDTRSSSFKEGGAIYLHNNVTATLSNCRVINNFSGANGAIENRGTLTITDSTITGNQTLPAAGSVVGGGIHNTGALSISRTTISGNSVRGEGGGIAISVAAGTAVTITDSTISGNTASVDGGGIGNGGGISTTGNQGTISLLNSTLSGNSADSNGGGAYFATPAAGTGNVTLTNVTVTNNVADSDNNGTGAGGGFAQDTASVTLRNTLVAGNFNSTAATRDDIAGAVLAASSYNLIGDGTGASGLTNGVNGNQVGSGATPINPLLGALANNGGSTLTHALMGGSSAIDQGSNALCPATDQRGQARPVNVTCDIGAFELADTAPPDTTIVAVPPNPNSSINATFSFSGADTGGSGLAGFQCAFDGGAFVNCTSPWTFAGLSDGSHTFQVRARDGASNVDPTPATYTWTVDTTAPDTAVTAQPTNPSSSSNATFSFAGNDGGGTGVWGFECSLDGSAYTTCTSPTTLAGLSEGSHTLTVRAVDMAGNVDPTSAFYIWAIDTSAPDTAITAQPANPTSSTNASFSFTGSDTGGSGISSFECAVDGGAFAACASPATFTGLPPGSHTFQVRAADNAGNVDPTPASYTWSINAVDTTAPDTAITAQPPNPSASTSATFSFTGSDAGGSGVAGFQCGVDGGAFTACTSPATFSSLAEGSHTFQVRAVDGAGNIDPTSASYTWAIDTTAPDTTITAQPGNPTTSANATFSFSGSDAGGSGVASFQCAIDGGAFATCTSPATFSSLSSGSHTFQARSVDGAGNVDATPATFNWAIDPGAGGPPSAVPVPTLHLWLQLLLASALALLAKRVIPPTRWRERGRR